MGVIRVAATAVAGQENSAAAVTSKSLFLLPNSPVFPPVSKPESLDFPSSLCERYPIVL